MLYEQYMNRRNETGLKRREAQLIIKIKLINLPEKNGSNANVNINLKFEQLEIRTSEMTKIRIWKDKMESIRGLKEEKKDT